MAAMIHMRIPNDLKSCLDDFKRGYSTRKSLNVATIGFEDFIYCVTLCAINIKL